MQKEEKKKLKEKLLLLPAISSAKVNKNKIIIKTNEIKFNSPRGKELNIGRFIILLRTELKQANISRRIFISPLDCSAKKYGIKNKLYFHPCIYNYDTYNNSLSTEICFGSGETKADIYNSLVRENYYRVIFVLLNFMSEPNYGQPYMTYSALKRGLRRYKNKDNLKDGDYFNFNILNTLYEKK